MFKNAICLLVGGLFVSTAWAQPAEWSDDFTTATTYDSASLLAPCSGGPATKYTILEALVSDIVNGRAVSGGGAHVFTDNLPSVPSGLPARVWLAVFGWVGLGIGCPGEPPPLQISEPFSSDDICMYGGMQFSPWQLNSGSTNLHGPDGQPGRAGIDDDLDGNTDEPDETPAARPTLVGGGFGSGDFGFPAGQDGQPGDAGIDDDGNGQTDEVGETGWPGTDDGDDHSRMSFWVMMRASLTNSETVHLETDLGSEGDLFNIRENKDLDSIALENNNEIAFGFYVPYTHYNYAFCTSGTCYGAMLWTETDMANPDETLGPVINTSHNYPTAVGCSFAYSHIVLDSAAGQYLRRMNNLGNSNFSHTYWICSGVPTAADFTNGIFGYPSPSADLDNDRDVDVNDFLTFSGCFAGSLVPPAGGCQNSDADLDDDGDVDVNDFLTFSGCFAGSLQRPNAACFPPDLTACGS